MFVFFIKWLRMLWRNESDAPKLALRGPPMMTSDAKRALAKTIRELREKIIPPDLREATERAYQLAIDAKKATLSEAARAKREDRGVARRADPRGRGQSAARGQAAAVRRADQGCRSDAAPALGLPAPARNQRPAHGADRRGRLGQPRLQGLSRGRAARNAQSQDSVGAFIGKVARSRRNHLPRRHQPLLTST